MRLTSRTDVAALGVIVLEGLDPARSQPAPSRPEPECDATAARKLYRAAGIDPTKTRPSCEALWRRLKKGQELPRINAVVDWVNFCSVIWMLPFGAYDADSIEGEVVLRIGEEGEGYEGIGKPRVNVAGRFCLCDDRGPFGNPTSDSFRTRVSEATRRALITVFAPADHPLDRLKWVAATMSEALSAEARTGTLSPPGGSDPAELVL